MRQRDDDDREQTPLQEVLVPPRAAVLGRRAQEPINEYDALMRCAPGDEPGDEITTDLKVALARAFEDALTEEDQWLLNMIYVERRSLRQIETLTGIPHTTITRLRDTALAKLKAALE